MCRLRPCSYRILLCAGRAWAKHDVLSWYWCHEASCEADKSTEWTEFDYHQTSQFYTSARYGQHVPGGGYGQGDPVGALY